MEKGGPILLEFYAAPKVPYYACFEGSFCLHLQVSSAQLFSFDWLTLKMKEINTSKIGEYKLLNMI